MDRENQKILLVDDRQTDLDFLSDILIDKGYVVEKIDSGEKIMVTTLNFLPDLILLDIRMSKIDGFEACKYLKANPNTQHIPIIFLSAASEAEDKITAFKIGGCDYITKPFQPEEVLVRVANQLQIQKLQNQLRLKNQKLNIELENKQYLAVELQNRNQQIELILKTAQVGISLIDERGYFVETNPAYCQMFGLTKDELIGQLFTIHYAHLSQTEQANLIDQYRDRIVHNTHLTHQNITFNHKNHSLFAGEMTLGVFQKENGEKYSVVTVLDNSKKCDRERYLAALVEIKRRLLAFDTYVDCYGEIIKILGNASQASRVYFFENHLATDGSLLMSQKAEWCAGGIESEFNNLKLQNISYRDFFPRWQDVLAKGEFISGIVKDFPDSEREILEPQNILSILILPIIVKGEFTGFLGFDSCEDVRVWEDAEIDFLQAAATSLALAQEREQAETALQRQLERSYLLKNTTDKIRSELDTQKLFATAAVEIGQALNVSRVLIHSYEIGETPKIPILGEFLVSGCASLLDFEIPILGNTHLKKVLSQDKAVASDDVSQEALLENQIDICHQFNIKSMLAVRTSYKGNLNGLICLHQCDNQRKWTEVEIELLESIAAQFGIAFSQTKLLENEKQVNIQLQQEIHIRHQAETALRVSEQKLRQSAEKLSQHNLILTEIASKQVLYRGDFDSGLREITEAGARCVAAERSNIWLYSDTPSGIKCLDLFESSINQHSKPDIQLAIAAYPDYFQALDSDRVIISENPLTDSLTKTLAESYLIPHNITALLHIPIHLGGVTVGVLCLEQVGIPHQWTLEDINFARSLSNLISLSLEARRSTRAEAKLASAFRSSPDPIALATFPDVRYVEVNDNFCRVFGYNREEIINRSAVEVEIWANINDCTHILEILGESQAISNYEVELRTNLGEIKTMLFSAELIEIDAQRYLLGTARDITERKQAENESRLLLLTTQAISRAVNVDSAISLVLRLIYQTIDWDFAEAWVPTDSGDNLEYRLGWYREDTKLKEFSDRSSSITFSHGIGLPGRVWQKKKPEWIEDVTKTSDTLFLRKQFAEDAELKAGFAVPILAKDKVLFVLVFFNSLKLPVDCRLLYLVSTVASQLGVLMQRKEAESAHRQSEERLQLALVASDLGMWDWSLETGKIYRDWRWKRMLGYEENEISDTRQAFRELVHPEDLAVINSTLGKYLRGESPIYRVEFRMRSKSGDWKWIQSCGKVFDLNERNKPLRLTGTHQDITERKLLERELALKEARLNAFFNNAPVGLCILDKELRFVQVNQLLAEINGVSIVDHIGKTLNQVLYQISAFIEPLYRQVLTTGEAILNQELNATSPKEPGILRNFLVSYFPILGDDGIPSDVGSVLVEITDLKRAELALIESADRERAVTQAIQRMRQTLDLETIFAATTQELRQVLGCDRVVVYRFNPDWSGKFVAESVGDGWISLIEARKQNPDLTEGALEDESCIVQRMNSKANQVVDTHLQDTEGGAYSRGASFLCVSDIYGAGFEDCYIQLLESFQAKAYITVPIFCGDKLWGLLASYQNSSSRHWKTGEINIVVQIGNQLGVALQQAELLAVKQRQSQALEKAAIAADAANRAKSEFLANMSHELRTPLNAILGFTQLMSRDILLNKENQQNLTIINRAGEHLLNLINDILEMSKIEAGRSSLNLSNFDLIKLLENLKEMLQYRATAKDLVLVFEYAINIPQYIQADASKLRQVLLNLLGNAIKFTKVGRVVLQVSLDVVEFTGIKYLNFEVIDTGSGIAAEEIKLLFEAFGQTETGRNSQQGTGLGLAISRKYIQLMGGNISVSSTVNVGSRFAFNIQIEMISEKDISSTSKQKQIIGLAPEQLTYRILVVDDAEDSRNFLVKLLGSIGFAVKEATNGNEAISVWSYWQPHMILMDMRMPIMDGYEATKEIKRREHQQGEIPCPSTETVIIALTANAFIEQRQAIIELGCDDFINKPFRDDFLLEKIQQYLKVEYIYQEVNNSTVDDIHNQNQPILSDIELIKMLSQFSGEWLEKLHNFAASCSDDLIIDFLEQIPSESGLLKDSLHELAHNFQFEKIMELTSIVLNQESTTYTNSDYPV
ncbi:GAF domain-containing protein [Brunnivagina elsteri]|uniref:Circadian input-output histidine kinase CikA n=1 Tax=Brunnivagina elsteri CCALA 953 TaxID=987040 RepID=A0A2A2TEY6_9CYAN|nr:GAF domain-containing protein [Calothrix elsteri]PAX52314.1 PAS domain S-box protein [Calothrix elsteri CCALA 953]